MAQSADRDILDRIQGVKDEIHAAEERLTPAFDCRSREGHAPGGKRRRISP